MKPLALLLLLAAGCVDHQRTPSPPEGRRIAQTPDAYVYRVDDGDVRCYVVYSRAISCVFVPTTVTALPPPLWPFSIDEAPQPPKGETL